MKIEDCGRFMFRQHHTCVQYNSATLDAITCLHIFYFIEQEIHFLSYEHKKKISTDFKNYFQS